MLKTANLRGWLRGFEVSRESTRSYTLADNTLIFCDADEEQSKYLRVILIMFKGVFGIRTNWRNSVICPINEVNNMSWLDSIMGGEI